MPSATTDLQVLRNPVGFLGVALFENGTARVFIHRAIALAMECGGHLQPMTTDVGCSCTKHVGQYMNETEQFFPQF